MESVKKILDSLGFESVDEMAVNESYTVEVVGFEDLTIEKIGENHLSVAHYYVQRGDLMSDPEIVFRVSGDEWLPVRYTQHPQIHQYDEDGICLDNFQGQWSENLRKQGFVQAAEEMSGGD